jgi:hypothetical protein
MNIDSRFEKINLNIRKSINNKQVIISYFK